MSKGAFGLDRELFFKQVDYTLQACSYWTEAEAIKHIDGAKICSAQYYIANCRPNQDPRHLTLALEAMLEHSLALKFLTNYDAFITRWPLL